MGAAPYHSYGIQFDPELAKYYAHLFIDEIHGARDQDVFFPFMDDPAVTTLFCTTAIHTLLPAFIERCVVLELTDYTKKDIIEMVMEWTDFDFLAAEWVADRSRNIPAIAREWVKRYEKESRRGTTT
jgi:replication-associated recombination protein RarA